MSTDKERDTEPRRLYDSNTCGRCPSYAPWSIADYNDALEPITTWFACGRHLALILRTEEWNLDAVEVRYWPRDAAEDPYAN